MTDSIPDTDTGAAFAAGVATAEAEQARTEASTAAVRADMAKNQAEEAARTAGDAMEQSWVTRAAVDDLAARFQGQLDEIKELVLAATAGDTGGPPAGQAAPGEGAVPAPERKDDAPAPVVEGDDGGKSKRGGGGYGSSAWFGKR